MNSGPTLIPEAQLSQISGGHGGSGFLFFLGLPHMIMGLREFVNYVGERWNNGCQNIEENDYFTNLICWLPNSISQENSAQITIETSA